MKKQKVAEIRKANQFTNKQITEIFNLTITKQLELPWSKRWRLALRILKGKRSVDLHNK